MVRRGIFSKKLSVVLLTLLAISLSIFIFGMIYQHELPKLVEEINNSTIGGILTAIITVLLLQGQTATEEERDKNLSIFEKKQEIFHNFMEKLKNIIMDGEIKIAQYTENANIDELKELLFELGYIQMHTSQENTQKIFQEVALIMQTLSDFSNEGNRRQQELPNFYGNLSQHLFKIVAILKNDLYGTEVNPISKNEVTNLLKECGLYIEQKEMDRNELQVYFWNQLQDEFLKRGYNFTKYDFSKDVLEFYRKARYRHRYYGFNLPIYTTKEGREIIFRIEIENQYFYGFRREDTNDKNAVIEQLAASVGGLTPSPWWFGYSYASSESKIDFWNMWEDNALKRLKNPHQRENLIRNIADEMELYIKKFIEIADQKEL